MENIQPESCSIRELDEYLDGSQNYSEQGEEKPW